MIGKKKGNNKGELTYRSAKTSQGTPLELVGESTEEEADKEQKNPTRNTNGANEAEGEEKRAVGNDTSWHTDEGKIENSTKIGGKDPEKGETG